MSQAPLAQQCPYYQDGICRSCSLMDQGYAASLGTKKAHLEGVLRELPNLPSLSPLVALRSPFQSRAKAKLSVSGDISAPVIGLVDKSLSPVPLTRCPLHYPEINALVEAVGRQLVTLKLPPYDIGSRKGELKGLIVTMNQGRDQGILRFVLRSSEAIPRIRKGLGRLLVAFPWLKVVTANIQPIPHAIMEGEEEVVLTDQETIAERYGGLELTVTPGAFIQVTPEIATKLYGTAREILAESGSRRVLDLYSGLGAFSLDYLAEKSAEQGRGVTLVELSGPATVAAGRTIERHDLRAVDIYRCSVDRFLQDHLAVSVGEMSSGEDSPGEGCVGKNVSWDTVICNPPRRGLGREVCELLLRLKAPQLLYSSCNPISLAQDLEILQRDYRVRVAIPFDMFPFTEHLEVLVHCVRSSVSDPVCPIVAC